MLIYLKNVKIRGAETRARKKDNSPYLLVKVADEEGAEENLTDGNMDNKPYYKLDAYADFTVRTRKGDGYTIYRIVEFSIRNNC